MSDFAITFEQRARLLAGDYDPLDFDTKPAALNEERGVEPGDVYVLSWSRASAVVCDDGHVIRIPRTPVWYLTVTSVQRHRKGFWRVRFDITDVRDSSVWLAPGGGYQLSRQGSPDHLPVVVDESVRGKVREEFWHARRLARHAEEMKARSRARRQRRAA